MIGAAEAKVVFISGVAGLLGSHLADVLLAQGCRVVGCDDLSGGYEDNIPRGVEFHRYNINDFSRNLELLKDVDVVYHTAAFAYDGLSFFCPYEVSQNTYSYTLSLLSAAVEQGVKRFVFCSSMARYGRLQPPFYELQTPKPVTPYGVAKYAAEMAIQSLSEVHGIEYVICVPHNVIGPRQRYDDPYRNVAAIMMNRMLLGQQPVIYGDGRQSRCFSFVQDCVRLMAQMGFDERAKNEIFNIGPDEEETSILHLAETIADILNFPLEPIYMPGRPAEVRLATCSSDKIRKVFAYETQYTLRSGLEEMAQWIRRRGPRPFQYDRQIEIKNQNLPKTWREAIL